MYIECNDFNTDIGTFVKMSEVLVNEVQFNAKTSGD